MSSRKPPPPANPLLSSGGTFSLADSFNVAAPLPVLGVAEEDSFIGGPSTPALQPSTAGMFQSPAMFQTPISFFNTPAPPPAPAVPTLSTSPQSVPLTCPVSPASPPPPLSTLPPPALSVLGPSPPGSSQAVPPRLFVPPSPLLPSSAGPASAPPKRPVYAPAPFMTPAPLPLTPSGVANLPPTPNLPTPNLPPPNPVFTPAPLSPPVPNITVHWFYQIDDKNEIWKPFSVEDSTAIEAALEQGRTSEGVPVEGTRYDVLIERRVRAPVYWTGPEQTVRRCSWFQRGSPEGRWVPYEEGLADRLEEEYQTAARSNRWQTKVVLEDGEWVMFHSPAVMLHFPSSSPTLGSLDDWGQVQPQSDPALRPRVVNRGLEGLPDIPDGESQEVDHLCFVVHGIGAACDIKFRPIAEVVDGFRELTAEISEKHFAGAHLASRANRVEFLPVNWHDKLHGEDTGTDSRIQPLTLRSIPKMRSFVNDTLLDVLFYTSPVYCQTILNTVCEQINSVYRLYCARNPGYSAGVSVIGHSLGSLILFDLLSGQTKESDEAEAETLKQSSPLVKPRWDKELTIAEVFSKLEIQEHLQIFTDQGIGMDELETCSEDDLKEAQLPLGPRKKLMKYLESRSLKSKTGFHGFQEFQQSSVVNRVSYCVGPAGTGQPSVLYPKLDVKLTAFFALGSPIGMFMAVRGVECLGSDFTLPTCPMFFNIFHPYDPVAYRIESLVEPSLSTLRPLLIPHHMGRKRMHLELKETMSRVGTDIKQKVMESLKATMGAVYSVAGSITGQASDQTYTSPSERQEERPDSPETVQLEVSINQGRRVDYVLQEAPMESFNEYVFAMASHLCYWNSEDTSLMVLRELYTTMDIASDDMLEQQAPYHPPPDLPRSSTVPNDLTVLPAPSALPPQTTYVPQFPALAPTPQLPPVNPGPPQQLPPITPGPPPPMFSVDSVTPSMTPRTRPGLSTSRPFISSASTPAMGMDPTAPVYSDKPLPPPPTMGFQRL